MDQSTSSYRYTFTGWSPTVTTATQNQTYTAQYTSTYIATPTANDFYLVMENDYDSDDGDTFIDLYLTNNYSSSITISKIEMYSNNGYYINSFTSTNTVNSGSTLHLSKWLGSGSDAYSIKMTFTANGSSYTISKNPNEFQAG